MNKTPDGKPFDTGALVARFVDIPAYSPPLHSGTVNRKLLPAEFGAGFEVSHGTLAPGGMGHRHYHATEWQIIILLKGEGRLELGGAGPQMISAGTVVRLPPGLPHLFVVTGNEPAEVIVAYCPPLGPDGFIAA